MGVLPIERDVGRFKNIVRGQVGKHLKKFMSSDELIGRQGRDIVKIPLPRIELPHFRFGKNRGGVGQGEGEEGDELGPGQPGDKPGSGGSEAGAHFLELWEVVEMVIDELLQYIELPDLLPLAGEVVEKILKVMGLTRNPTSLVAKKATMRNVLAKVAVPGQLDWARYMSDRRFQIFKNVKEIELPSHNLELVYIFDISGSITQNKREIIRQMMFWLDAMFDRLYKDRGTVSRTYFAHDTEVYRLPKKEAMEISTGGGTVVSVALRALLEHTKRHSDANLITVYLGDGENFGASDDELCGQLLKQLMLEHPWFRGFYYGSICPSSYSSLLNELRKVTNGLATGLGTNVFRDTTINDLEEVPNGILGLFGRKGAIAEAGL